MTLDSAAQNEDALSTPSTAAQSITVSQFRRHASTPEDHHVASCPELLERIVKGDLEAFTEYLELAGVLLERIAKGDPDAFKEYLELAGVPVTSIKTRHLPSSATTAPHSGARDPVSSDSFTQANLVAYIEAVLFRHDPIGLNLTTNTDEYQSEALNIARHLPTATSVHDVQRIVHQEFVHQFTPTIAGPETHYATIAETLWNHCDNTANT